MGNAGEENHTLAISSVGNAVRLSTVDHIQTGEDGLGIPDTRSEDTDMARRSMDLDTHGSHKDMGRDAVDHKDSNPVRRNTLRSHRCR